MCVAMWFAFYIVDVWMEFAAGLGGLSRHRLSQAQSNRDRLPFLWCGGPEGGFGGVFWLCGGAAIVLMVPFWGCVLVVLWWFRWRRFRWCFGGVKSFCGRVVLWCRVVVFAVECQREVFGKSGVERCWGRVLSKSVGVRVLEQSCKSVAEKALTKCCRTYSDPI